MAVNSTSAEVKVIVPGDAFARLEGDGLAVRRGVPAFRENADGLAVQIDQIFLDLPADDVDACRGLNAGIKLLLFGAVVDIEYTALVWRLLCERAHRIEHALSNRSRRQQRGAAINLQTREIRQKPPQTTICPVVRWGRGCTCRTVRHN